MSEIEFYRFCLIRSKNDKTEKKNRRTIITFITSLTLIENILVIKKKKPRGSQEPVSFTWFIQAMQKRRTAYGSHVSCQSAQNEKDLSRTSQTSIMQSNNSLDFVLSRERIKQKSSHSEKKFHRVTMFVFQSGLNEETLHRTFPFDRLGNFVQDFSYIIHTE